MQNVIVYAASAKNDEIRLNSSSGGVFSVLAYQILMNNGVIYGVKMNENCRKAEYARISTVEELGAIQGSKYLQAHMGDVYKNVKKDLDNNLAVMFSGVGCQINGLRNYLGDAYDNLICIDVVCHGVPSPKLWNKYVDELEKKTQATLVSVNFRCKDKGWHNFGMKKLCDNGKEFFSLKKENPYMLMFLDNFCLRPSCYACAAKMHKLSDISLADFWGIEKVEPEMNDERGTSLVLLRTDKGKTLFEKVKKDLKIKEVSYEAGVKENSAEFKSVAYPTERDKFFEDLDALDFKAMKKKYAIPVKVSYKRKIENLLKRLILKKGLKG